ncbi:MAG: arginine--tRNA ligase, partial [Patescibacteria group bacterium]
ARVGKTAKETAKSIVAQLDKSEETKKRILKMEIAGPGFINFFLKNEVIVSELEEIGEKAKKGFGFRKGEKINIEPSSANPTGQFHIGHGRGAFYGDTLANILEFTGGDLTREYYINDSRESNQIKELGKTTLGQGETYLTEKLKTQIARLKTESQDIGVVGFLLARIVQSDNREFIEKKLGIRFDIWYSEDEKLRATLLNDRTLAALKMKELVYEKDGAVWLKTSEYGDDEDRVIIRSDESKTYFLSDISYHGDKFARGYDVVIDVFGADHHGHVKRMMAAKKMLGWKGDLKIFVAQMVSLKENGVSAKMSKRAGNVVLLKDLVDEFGLDVVRWFYNEKALSTQMEFDMALAKEHSAKNPVFYVQYAHARMNSILEKAKSVSGDNVSIEAILKEPSAKNLALKILQFAEVLEEIANDYQAHRLTTYAYELASAFSAFYRDVQVVGEGSYNTGALATINITKITLAK